LGPSVVSLVNFGIYCEPIGAPLGDTRGHSGSIIGSVDDFGRHVGHLPSIGLPLVLLVPQSPNPPSHHATQGGGSHLPIPGRRARPPSPRAAGPSPLFLRRQPASPPVPGGGSHLPPTPGSGPTPQPRAVGPIPIKPWAAGPFPQPQGGAPSLPPTPQGGVSPLDPGWWAPPPNPGWRAAGTPHPRCRLEPRFESWGRFGRCGPL
jgi:hypothetical protein